MPGKKKAVAANGRERERSRPERNGPGRSGVPKAIAFGKLNGYLGYKLRLAQQADYADFARAVGDIDVSPGRFSLLTLLAANPGITQTDLSRAVNLDKSTLTPALDQLERRGLIERRRIPSDRRALAIHLSGEGHALLAYMTEQVERHETSLSALFTPAEKRQLIRFLSRIAERLPQG